MAEQKTKNRTLETPILSVNDLVRQVFPEVPKNFYTATWFSEKWNIPRSTAHRWCTILAKKRKLKVVKIGKTSYYGPVK